MIGFFAEPTDLLFSGPPGGTRAGFTNRAESVFPPSPTTFQGAVRARIVDVSGVSLEPAAIEALVGPPDRLRGGWSLDGPWVAQRREKRLCAEFKAPLWLTCDARVVDRQIPMIATRPELTSALVVTRSDRVGAWLDDGEMWAALEGRTDLEPRPGPHAAEEEERPGLKLSRDSEARTAEDGMLYALVGHRFRDGAGLVGWLDAPEAQPEWLTSGFLRFGRRSRPLTLSEIAPLSSSWARIRAGAHLSSIGASEDTFWLYLAQPAAFDHPSAGTVERPALPAGVEVLAALVGPALELGGLRTGGRPRPVRAFAPAGSCWLIRVASAPADRPSLLRSLHNRPAVGHPDDRTFGHGITFVARHKRSSG